MNTTIRTPHLPSGIEDFAKIRRLSDGKQLSIVDKTMFLPQLLGYNSDEVTVFTRPIRFMKSSILSMLHCFLSIQNNAENKALFSGLAISAEEYAEFRAQHQGKFPVIYLNLKNIQARTWVDAKKSIGKTITSLYKNHKIVMSSLSQDEKNHYQHIMNNKYEEVELEESLADLATYLSTHYKKKVIILIDEYDTPLHRAHIYTNAKDRSDPDSYFQMMNYFLGAFFGSALKGHPHVEKGFMTGVLRTAFASLVSSLNNAKAYSVLSPKFSELFGFTETEVEYFINQIEGIDNKERDNIRKLLQNWYNGYCIGDSKVRIYNPWSVAQFFNDLPASPNLAARAYWLQTGDSLALSEFLNPRFERLKAKLTELILGRTIQVVVDERTTLSSLDLPGNDSAFWGLLLHAGYLSSSKVQPGPNTTFICDVSIPNYEVSGAYAYLINNYYQCCMLKDQDPFLDNYNDMLENLIYGDIDKFAAHLKIYMEQAVSFHDIPKLSPKYDSLQSSKSATSTSVKIREEIYHAFMLGILAGLHSRYFQVSSNREAGYGRYDIALTPHENNKHGLIFEFKATNNPNKLKVESENALKQINDKNYATALIARGISNGIHIGISFCGKSFSITYEKIKYSTASNVAALAEQLPF